MDEFYAIIHKLMWKVLGVGWIKCGAYSILQRPMWMLLYVETNMKRVVSHLNMLLKKKIVHVKIHQLKENAW